MGLKDSHCLSRVLIFFIPNPSTKVQERDIPQGLAFGKGNHWEKWSDRRPSLNTKSNSQP